MDHVDVLRSLRRDAASRAVEEGDRYILALDAAITALSAKPEGEAVSVQGQAECTCHYMAPRNCPYTPHNSEPDTRSHGVVVDDALVELAEQKLLECGCEIIPSRDAMLAAITTIIEELQNET